jgi:hypothetical protein
MPVLYTNNDDKQSIFKLNFVPICKRRIRNKKFQDQIWCHKVSELHHTWVLVF